MTTELDFAALAATQPALAAFVTEPRMVVAHTGAGGTFVAWRPFDDEDVHICTLRDTPTRVLLEVVRERDANWGERAVQTVHMLARGALVPVVDGAHLVINERLLGWNVTGPAPEPVPARPPSAQGAVTATMGERLEIDNATVTEQLLYSDLARWPELAAFVSPDVFVDGYEGPRGVFVVYRMGSYGGLDFRQMAIVTMRGDVRTLVWLLLDDPQGWSDEDNACACAWALADGLIGTKDHDGQLVVDEFDADKALDAF